MGDHQEVKQQQESNVEGEENKDQEEAFSDITSFPLPFLHLTVLHISGSSRLGGKMPVCGNTSLILQTNYEYY